VLALTGRWRWALALVAAWALLPLALLVVNVARHGGVLTGAFGADAYDQLAYLAWIRDSAQHWLASDLWVTHPTAHDYLQPMYFLSGLLVRAGMGIQLAYLLWVPVGLVVLVAGFALFVEQVIKRRRAQVAALLLGLFYVTPLVALDSWFHLLNPGSAFNLTLATFDAYNGLDLWGFDATAVAIGLMPVFLLAVGRLVTVTGEGSSRRDLWGAALAGMAVSWLHPWQGVTLLGVLVGLVAFSPRARSRVPVLVVPVLFTVAPLVYGTLLAHYDPVWSGFQAKTTGTGTQPWWALAASLGPLCALGGFGLRRAKDERDLLVMLWPVSAAAVYFLVPEFPPHALGGVTLPLAVLAVRGWQRLGAAAGPAPPRRRRAWLGAAFAAAAVAAVTVPQAVVQIRDARADIADPTHAAARQLLIVNDSQAAAFRWLARAQPGGVLAPGVLALSIPALTGLSAYDGHAMWQPTSHELLAAELYAPVSPGDQRSRARRRAILRRAAAAGVRYLLLDCGTAPAIAAALGPPARPARRFGCLTVFSVPRR
jgi:hypothetical protein